MKPHQFLECVILFCLCAAMWNATALMGSHPEPLPAAEFASPR